VKYDAVVIGAGPAGSSCAAELANRGMRVLLLDKKRFPRQKLCGGCVSSRINPYLPKGWQVSILNPVKGAILGFKDIYEKRKVDIPVAWTVDRSLFDTFLLREAERKGADVLESAEFFFFEDNESFFKVITSAGVFKTDFLIGADGFYTKVGRQLGYRRRQYFRSVEVEGEGNLKEEVFIKIGVVSRGYFWIFPKRDKVNIGIATTGKEQLPEVLKECVTNGSPFNLRRTGKPKSWPIPFSTKREDIHLGKGKVVLVGDAAGLVDPLLGEGIYYAVRSGILAGKFIADGKPEEYRKAVLKEIAPELIYAAKIANLAYRFQEIAFRMGKSYAIEQFFHLLSGRENFKSIYMKGLPLFFLYMLESFAKKTARSIFKQGRL